MGLEASVKEIVRIWLDGDFEFEVDEFGLTVLGEGGVPVHIMVSQLGVFYQTFIPKSRKIKPENFLDVARELNASVKSSEYGYEVFEREPLSTISRNSVIFHIALVSNSALNIFNKLNELGLTDVE